MTGKMKIPDNHMAFGNPARIIRELTEEEIKSNQENAREYVELIKEY